MGSRRAEGLTQLFRPREGAETEAVPGPSAPPWLFQGRRVNSSRDRRCCARRLTGWECAPREGTVYCLPLTEREKNRVQCVCAECSQGLPDACEESGKLSAFQMGGSGSQAGDVVV